MGQQPNGGGRVVLWDFDGTLAYRPGEWRGCLLEVLDECEPGHGISSEAIRPHLRDGFPWHRPDLPHPELADPDVWWARVQSVLARSLTANGMTAVRAGEIALAFRTRYVDGSRAWTLCDDAVGVLTRLAGEGWQHIVLSNHVPELPAIVGALGLGSVVERVISSATTGYEKPHPEMFAHALDVAGRPATVWMVGDNADADVGGAQAAGIPAILVQHPQRHPATSGAVTLLEAERIIRTGSAASSRLVAIRE